MLETKRILETLQVQHANDSFLALTTDGINFLLSDQEICDVINQCQDPTEAADVIAQQVPETQNPLVGLTRSFPSSLLRGNISPSRGVATVMCVFLRRCSTAPRTTPPSSSCHSERGGNIRPPPPSTAWAETSLQVGDGRRRCTQKNINKLNKTSWRTKTFQIFQTQNDL